MKLTTYIHDSIVIERLHISSDTKSVKIQPRNKSELKKIIEQELNRQGPDADLNFIDTSLITDMSFLFSSYDDIIMNIKIDRWDTSNVTEMEDMFATCSKFNCDLSKWNVSNVKNMNGMFYRCRNFESDLSAWNVSSATDMTQMFYKCSKFTSDLSHWNVSNVTNMSYMFGECRRFTSDLTKWKPKETDKHAVEYMFLLTKIEKTERLIPEWYKVAMDD